VSLTRRIVSETEVTQSGLVIYRAIQKEGNNFKSFYEVTSEPAITRYASIVRKALKVLICYLKNTQYGNPVSHGTRQSDSPFLSRLSPACPCLWLPQRRWCAVSILEDHLAGMVRGWWINSETCAEQPLHSCYRFGIRKLQDTERLLLWSRHFVTRSTLAAAARNTFPRQLQTNFERFSKNCCISSVCRLTGYVIINMWKCYIIFELPCSNTIHIFTQKHSSPDQDVVTLTVSLSVHPTLFS
jgi:hypothetical protein